MVKHETPDVRRMQLFQAAMAVCAEKGYHATTVEEIAERAGLSKGALYHHFKSKQDLFVELLEGSMDEFAEMIAHADSGWLGARSDPLRSSWPRSRCTRPRRARASPISTCSRCASRRSPPASSATTTR